jgi:Na+-driven multidrug efflux pump
VFTDSETPIISSIKIERNTSSRAWKELLSLLFPILVVLLGSSAVGAFERLCLSCFSLDALNSGVESVCALKFFQLSCVAFASMAQVFIGQYIGSKEPEKVGGYAWQMIWLSMLSILIVLPLSQITKPIFFKGLEHSQIASRYFDVLISGNFFFPLGTVLSSFFLAQGKRWTVVWATMGASSKSVFSAKFKYNNRLEIRFSVLALSRSWSYWSLFH